MPTTESSSSLRFVLPTGFFLRGTLRLEEDAAYSRHTFHFLPLENSKASHQALGAQQDSQDAKNDRHQRILPIRAIRQNMRDDAEDQSGESEWDVHPIRPSETRNETDHHSDQRQDTPCQAQRLH
jgi:hypothetical protein